MKTLLTKLILTTAITGMSGIALAEEKSHGYAKHQSNFSLNHKQRGYLEVDYKSDRKSNRYDDRNDNRRFSDRAFDDRYDAKGKKRQGKFRGGEKLRLDLPVRVRGDQRLALKRLARDYHGINLNDYRLVRVVVDSHGRRDGAARLRVGQRVSDIVYLGNGRSVIHAPKTRANGRWVLKLDDARVSNVRLVLEPRKRYHASNKRDRFAHKAIKGNNWALRW